MQNDSVNEQLPRSPYDMVNGVIYFARTLEKIRLYAPGLLSENYHNNLGRDLDACCLTFLHIEFDEGRTPPDLRKWEPPRLSWYSS